MELADFICPRTIVWASDQQHYDNTAVVPLPPYNKTANLKRIICNSHEPVLLRLLVCKELKEENNQNKCPFVVPPYTDHKNTESNKQLCNETKDRTFTQIYFRHEKVDIKTHSYVVTFIEGDTLKKTNVLLERFKNTVEWLQIAEEKPIYYVVLYGDPQFKKDYITVGNELDEEMRKLYSQYSKDEEICFIISANKKAEVLRLYYSTMFSVNVQ